MAFQGDLRNIGLATVFQNLQQNLQSGTLRLQRENGERFLYVKEGQIAMFSAGEGSETPLGEFLIRAGKLTAEDLEAAQRKRRKGSRLGGVLERTGEVSAKDVQSAVQRYVEEELYDLFTWTDGKFVFEEGTPSEAVFDAEMRNGGVSLDPNVIILEAARRVDEWERINRVVGSLGDIYVVRREKEVDLEKVTDSRLKRVAGYLDGRRDVAAVIRDSALGRFAVCHALSRLLAERIVRHVSADELRKLAEQAELSSDIEEAVRLMRRALELERNDISLRRRLAALLERSGESQEAATEYKLLAHSFMDSGRTTDAVASLRKAIELMPTDVTTRERLFQLLSDSGGKTVAIETGLALATTYSTLGLSEKARGALERLLVLGPSDRQPVERKLIEAHLALGDVKAAIEQLRKIAHRAMKGRDYDEAAQIYEEILKLDSKDEEARKRVAEIQAGVIERVLERRRARMRSAIVAAIALPVIAFVVREMASRPAETEMRLLSMKAGIAAARLLEKAAVMKPRIGSGETGAAYEAAAARFDEAIGLIDTFRSAWGWTIASRAAGKELGEWRSLAATAWMSAAEAYERVARFEDAYRIYTRLSRSPDVPCDTADAAQEAGKRLESQGLVSVPRGDRL